MKIGYKIWIEDNGRAFGEGPFQLLQRIPQKGSLLQAAKSMKMSYQKAWLIIRKSEEMLGFPLLERRVGGISGGGSQVTEEGLEFLKTYGRFRKETAKKLNASFQKHFDRYFGNAPDNTEKK